MKSEKNSGEYKKGSNEKDHFILTYIKTITVQGEKFK